MGLHTISTVMYQRYRLNKKKCVGFGFKSNTASVKRRLIAQLGLTVACLQNLGSRLNGSLTAQILPHHVQLPLSGPPLMKP